MKPKTKGRQAFNFLLSYNRVIEKLETDSQQCELMNIIRKVHFLQIKIDDVQIKNKMVDLAFESIKHSLEKSVYAYLDKAKPEDMGCYGDVLHSTPLCTPHSTPHSTQQEEEKEEEKGQVQVPFLKENDFTLKSPINYSKTSLEYKQALQKYLEAYIEDLVLKILQAGGKKEPLDYESFILSIEAKDYKYANFVKAYRTWNRRN